jgi:hypothetical protein
MACHCSIFLLRQQRLHQRDLLVEGHLFVGGIARNPDDLSRPVRIWSRAWISPLPSNPPLLALPAGIIPRSLASPGFRGPDGGVGYADQAQRRSQEALALAQHVAHTPSPAFAESYAAVHSQSCRDLVATQACAEALMALPVSRDLWSAMSKDVGL